MSKVGLYERLHRELIDSGVLPANAPRPSNQYHRDVTLAVLGSSWIEGRWVPDETFAERLKKLRDQAKLTQEQLAEKSGLDVGTVRQLEQGTRRNPQWQTVCALAYGLKKEVIVFVGTEEVEQRLEWGQKERVIMLDIEDTVGPLSENRREALFTLPLPALEEVAQQVKDHPEDAHAIIGRAIGTRPRTQGSTEDRS
jgi:transcriptional regulator with XRE-family HTH domain